MGKKNLLQKEKPATKWCEVRPQECDGSCQYAKGKKKEGC